jgi:4-hydroxybenzoate polyprenyltransferase
MLSFFFKSNVWLGFCAMALSCWSLLKMTASLDWAYHLWVYAFIVTYYGLHGRWTCQKDHLSDSAALSFFTGASLWWVVIPHGMMVIWMLFLTPWSMSVAMLILMLCSAAYDMPYLSRRSSAMLLKMSVREWPHLKAFAVATFMAMVLVVVPIMGKGTHVSWIELMMFTMMVWFHILINTICGDLRDVDKDAEKGMRTIGVTLGFDTTKKVLLCLCFAWSILGYWQKDTVAMLAFGVHGVLIWTLVKKTAVFNDYHKLDVCHWIPLLMILFKRNMS